MTDKKYTCPYVRRDKEQCSITDQQCIFVYGGISYEHHALCTHYLRMKRSDEKLAAREAKESPLEK